MIFQKMSFPFHISPRDLDGMYVYSQKIGITDQNIVGMMGIISLLEQFFLLLITFFTYFVICTYIFLMIKLNI